MSKMKVQVSRVFANWMNATFAERNLPYHASVVKMSESAYRWYVSDPDLHLEDMVGDDFKAIIVEYPDHYHAIPRYLSTSDLNVAFRACNVQSEADLKECIVDLVEL